jgi:zinc D-Ala-D-Ala carboxypeptidase
MQKSKRTIFWIVFAVLLVGVAGFIYWMNTRVEVDIKVELPKPTRPSPIVPETPPKEEEKPKPKAEKGPDKPVKEAIADPNQVRICPNSRETIKLSQDGRLLGHFAYADAAASDLSETPQGFGKGSCTKLHGEAKIALERMMTAAREQDPALGDAMIGLSCFRSSAYQREVFCRKVSEGYAVRAKASAPPGFSEHATGLAIDFGDKNVPECNLSACFAQTPVGQWLAQNAGTYGFVLSFPKGNAQGVMYEPWHWRYEGSPATQAIFAATK